MFAWKVEDDRGAQANVDDWHTDSYPFVCIVMLSDPSDMLGGETVCQKAGDELFPIRFPTSGSAIVMQVGKSTLIGKDLTL